MNDWARDRAVSDSLRSVLDDFQALSEEHVWEEIAALLLVASELRRLRWISEDRD